MALTKVSWSNKADDTVLFAAELNKGFNDTQTLANAVVDQALVSDGSTPLVGATVVATPATNKVALAALTTDGFGVAKSAAYTKNEAGYRFETGGGAAKNVSGVAVDIAQTFISASGITPITAGSAGIVNDAGVMAGGGATGVPGTVLLGASLNALGRSYTYEIVFSAGGSSSSSVQFYLGNVGNTTDLSLGSFTGLAQSTNWLAKIRIVYLSSTHLHSYTELTSIATGSQTPTVSSNINTALNGTSVFTGNMFLTVWQVATGTSQVALRQIIPAHWG